MKCPQCGENSTVFAKIEQTFATHRRRTCALGHPFNTVEVHPTQLGDIRRQASALRRLKKQIARHHRDAKIVADNRSVAVVAAEHNISGARVRQIRASHQKFLASDR